MVLAFRAPLANIVDMSRNLIIAQNILPVFGRRKPCSSARGSRITVLPAAMLAGAMLVATMITAMSIDIAWAQDTKFCSSTPIVARGEPSSFEWLAKTKARANWRHRVRSTTELGTEYSDWKLSANLEESCLVGTDGTVCTITAVPCRK